MKRVQDILPPEAAADPEQCTLRIAKAYGALFSGQGSRDDADLVLIDLAQFSRYQDTASLDAPADVVKALDQRRAVFLRIVDGIVLSGGDVNGLHMAVLTSPAPDVEET